MKSIKLDIIYNVIGNLVPILCAVLFIPQLMTELGLERFGVMTILWALVGYFGIFDLGISRALTFHAAKATAIDSPEPLAPAVKAGLLIVLIAGGLGLICVLGASGIISAQLLKENSALFDETRTALVITAITIPITTVGNGLRGVLEGLAKFKQTAWIKAVTGASFFAAPALLGAFGLKSLAYIATSFLVVRLIAAALCWYSVCSDILYISSKAIKATKLHRKALLSYGSWVLVSAIISPLMVYGDRFIVSHVLGAAEVGIYAVLQEMMGRSLILAASVTAALLPRFVQGYGSEEHHQYRKYSTTLSIGLGGFYCVVWLVIRPVSELWLGMDMGGYNSIFTYFSVALFLNSLAQLPYFYLLAKSCPDVPAKIHVAEFAFYVPACLVATKMYGLNGAAAVWVGRVFLDYILLRWSAKKILTQ